jgi:hypothetical protein
MVVVPRLAEPAVTSMRPVPPAPRPVPETVVAPAWSTPSPRRPNVPLVVESPAPILRLCETERVPPLRSKAPDELVPDPTVSTAAWIEPDDCENEAVPPAATVRLPVTSAPSPIV